MVKKPINDALRLCAATFTAAVIVVAGGDSAAQVRGSDVERLDALENELASLEHEIALLEDVKAVKRLQRAYGYYLDKGRSSEIAALFANDATLELGGSGVYVGKDHIAKYLEHLLGNGPKPGELANHLILQGVVHVDPSGTSAKGRWRGFMQLGKYGESATWAEGPYENEYVKQDGVWKFSKVHWYATVIAPYSPGWHKAPQPMSGPSKDLPPDRPPTEVYQSYPSAYLPPYHYNNPVTGRPTQVPK
jgi:hypothetical protein